MVKINGREVGEGKPCYVVAEIGINHNGSMVNVIRLIDAAVDAGCEAVKFQKRTLNLYYTQEELDAPREGPFGTTYGDQKRGLEFNFEQYKQIDAYCHSVGIDWFASCWDVKSVDFINQFNPPAHKIASALLTNDALLKQCRLAGVPIILSTGMSTLEQIDHAVDVLGTKDLIILHCNSTYPSVPDELNLRVIETLKTRYGVPVGYSGHEVCLATTLAAATLGACMVERHITLDRSMWGTDQAASVEPHGFKKLVRDIRIIESALGDGIKRVYDSELPIMRKLRK